MATRKTGTTIWVLLRFSAEFPRRFGNPRRGIVRGTQEMTRNCIEKGRRLSRFLTSVSDNPIPVHERGLLSQQPRGDAMSGPS